MAASPMRALISNGSRSEHKFLQKALPPPPPWLAHLCSLKYRAFPSSILTPPPLATATVLSVDVSLFVAAIMPRTRARRSARTQRSDTSAEPTPSTSNQRDETWTVTLAGLAAQLAQLEQQIAASWSHENSSLYNTASSQPGPSGGEDFVSRTSVSPSRSKTELHASRRIPTELRAGVTGTLLPGPPRPSGEVSLFPFRSCSRSSPAAALPLCPERPTPPSTSQTTRTALHTTLTVDRSTWSARARHRNPASSTFLHGFWPGQCLPLSANPELTPQLFAYQRTIVKAAFTYRPAAWLCYDIAFRRQAAANPLLRWDAIVQDLWTVCMAQGPVNPFCKHCRHRHPVMPEECFRGSPSQPRQPRGSSSSSSYRHRSHTSVCMDFQRGRCFRPHCIFRHVCRLCAGNHTVLDYHSSRAANGAASDEQASSGDDYFAEYFPNIFEEGTSFNSWESEGEVSDVSSAAGFIQWSETDSEYEFYS